jgi:hypothetical protein
VNGQILRTPTKGTYRGVFTPSTQKLPKNVDDLAVTGSKPEAGAADAPSDVVGPPADGKQ